LELNSQSMQKSIGGLPALVLYTLYKATIYKGAIDCAEHNRNNYSAKTDGNVYNPKFSFPKDAKRITNGT
jgi:hypothetical protein